MSTTETRNTDIIKMVESALRVLDFLRAQHTSVGVNDIARQCKLNPSTTFRILKTLEISGWVFQLSNDQYILGEKIAFVTEKNDLYLALRDVADIVMGEYTGRCNRPMNLMVRHGKHCTILHQTLTNSLVHYVPPLHAELPFHATSGGKVLLSELPEAIVDSILGSDEMESLTPYTLVDPNQFKQVLVKVLKDGYAIDHRESSIDGSCIAVPVRDNMGTIIASLSFSGFINIEDPQSLEVYVPPLREASGRISHLLYKTWNF